MKLTIKETQKIKTKKELSLLETLELPNDDDIESFEKQWNIFKLEIDFYSDYKRIEILRNDYDEPMGGWGTIALFYTDKDLSNETIASTVENMIKELGIKEEE